MSGSIVLALRLITALALFGFLGWVLIFLYREVNRQGLALAGRRVPGINISVNHAQGNPILKQFFQPEIMLGRDPACDIPIMDDTASTKHAYVTQHFGMGSPSLVDDANVTFLTPSPVDMPT